MVAPVVPDGGCARRSLINRFLWLAVHVVSNTYLVTAGPGDPLCRTRVFGGCGSTRWMELAKGRFWKPS